MGFILNHISYEQYLSDATFTVCQDTCYVCTVSGGLVFAKKMRDQSYLTMLDPFQELYGNSVVFMVYIASLCGDIFWTASILSALGEI